MKDYTDDAKGVSSAIIAVTSSFNRTDSVDKVMEKVPSLTEDRATSLVNYAISTYPFIIKHWR